MLACHTKTRKEKKLTSAPHKHITPDCLMTIADASSPYLRICCLFLDGWQNDSL